MTDTGDIIITFNNPSGHLYKTKDDPRKTKIYEPFKCVNCSGKELDKNNKCAYCGTQYYFR